MNDFINGIFRIWEKLPDQSKDAFTKQLGFREKSALHVGSQLLKYYVDLTNQAPEPNPNPQGGTRRPNQSQRNTRSKQQDIYEYEYEYEYDEQTNSYVKKRVSNTHSSKSSVNMGDDDDDIIDAEWTEKQTPTHPIENVQKPKTTRKRKK